MSGDRVEDQPEEPLAIPAGTVALWLCVRCGRELGWGPSKAAPGGRVGGSKFSGLIKRYCCAECLRNPREYWR